MKTDEEQHGASRPVRADAGRLTPFRYRDACMARTASEPESRSMKRLQLSIEELGANYAMHHALQIGV